MWSNTYSWYLQVKYCLLSVAWYALDSMNWYFRASVSYQDFLNRLLNYLVFKYFGYMMKVLPDSRRVHFCINRGLLLTRKTSQQCARFMFSIIIGRLLQNICITDDTDMFLLSWTHSRPFTLFFTNLRISTDASINNTTFDTRTWIAYPSEAHELNTGV